MVVLVFGGLGVFFLLIGELFVLLWFCKVSIS